MENEKQEKTEPGNGRELFELQKIEVQLFEAVKSDVSTWQASYKLMHQVEEQQLYKAKGLRSFTAWINSMAVACGCNVSLLWARLRAGRAYAEYAERAQAAGRTVPDIEQIKVSPDTLGLCSSVAGSNAAAMDHLVDQAVAGDLSREDLREAAQARRSRTPEKTVKSGQAARARAKERRVARSADGVESEKAQLKAEPMTAEQIVLVLRRDRSWFGKLDERPYIDRKYRVFTEFRCDTGSSKAARRFDVLAVETLTVPERDTVKLHGVEIKVSKEDLLRDHKMQEYTYFCDYFYLAVPDTVEMIQAAEDVRLPEWGVLAVSSAGALKVIHAAECSLGINRHKTITTALIKSI